VGRNPNVFFEIGVASALQKPCLLVASRPSDAGMMQGAYPIIITTPSKRAVQELGRHLNVLNRILESACA
jgi:hypothetical protein